MRKQRWSEKMCAMLLTRLDGEREVFLEILQSMQIKEDIEEQTEVMKKICVFWLLILCFVLQGCEKTNDQEYETNTCVAQSVSTENDDMVKFERNPYFFQKEHVYLQANAKYQDGAELVETTAYLESYLVKKYEYGTVYRLKIEPLGDLIIDRYNIYFYVSNNKIHKVYGFLQEDNKVITFRADDERLTEMLDTDEKLINNGYIVCQENETTDDLEAYETGDHFAFQKSENQITFDGWTIQGLHELYYYETLVWEEGKGLVEFTSGFGTEEQEILYLTEIMEIDEETFRANQPAPEENEGTAEFAEIWEFLQKDYMDLKANAEYVDDDRFEKSTVFAEWYLVKNYEYGSVYRLKVEPVGNLTLDRLNIYFYITNGKIYRLWSYVYGENEVIDFYDNDELLTEILYTDEKLKNNGVVVCQDEEIEDELEEYEEGQHTSLHKWRKQIIYNSYYQKANGDLNYYETFVWEEGKGLVEFTSGFRVERDILYLTDITETIVEG